MYDSMPDFNAKSIAILGRQPALGLAELESLFGAAAVQPVGDNALLSLDAADVPFKRLGGSLKIARVLTILPTHKWSQVEKYLVEKVPEHLQYVDPGKFTLGLSAHNLPITANDINKTALKIKKAVRQKTDRPVRVVPNKELALNTAQVIHNKLTSRGAWELLIIAAGDQTYLAQTFFVQDIADYAARDQARPARDSKVGMLPPKLAQIIINLAVSKTDPKFGDIVLDPFCGTGVILQEATLMGFDVYGTDLNQTMIEFSDKNLMWLLNFRNMPIARPPEYQNDSSWRYFKLELGDATSHNWGPKSFIASETYLGRPFTSPPSSDVLSRNIQDCNLILKKFLQNIGSQLESGSRLSLAMPAWRSGKHFQHLPLLDQLTDLGYNRVSFVHTKNDDLIYFREDQIVARELVVLQKN